MPKHPAKDLSEKLLIKPGRKVSLSDHEPADTAGWNRGDELDETLRNNLSRIERCSLREHRTSLPALYRGRRARSKSTFSASGNES